jgi:hypothetical protein
MSDTEPTPFDDVITKIDALLNGIGKLTKTWEKRGAQTGYGFTLLIPAGNGPNFPPQALSLLPYDPSRSRAIIMGASGAGLVFGTERDVTSGNGIPLFTFASGTQGAPVEIKTIANMWVGNISTVTLSISVWVECD